MEQNELDLRDMFQVLVRRLWMLVTLPVIAGLIAGGLSLYVLTPIYSASTTLWVIKDGGSDQINLNDVMLSRNLTKTYAQVATSRAVMSDAIERLSLKGKLSVEQLQDRLTVTPVKDTEILSFTIQDPSPTLAAKLADSVAEAFQGQIRTYMKVENVVVVDSATVPDHPNRPRPLLNVTIAIVLGILGAVGLAFLLEYLDTSVKSPEDVTRHTGLPVLGVIPLIDIDGAENSAHRHQRKRTHTVGGGVGM